jgi:hypothetical protein
LEDELGKVGVNDLNALNELRAPGVESLKSTPEKTSEFSPKTI